MLTNRKLQSILLLLFIGSIAPLFGQNGAQATSLLIESLPAGANVLINDKLLGVTPYEYSYAIEDGKVLDLRVELEDHQARRFSVRPQKKNSKLFVNAMLFHIPSLVGKDSPNNYAFKNDKITVQLFKKMPENDREALLPMVNIEKAIESGAAMGTLNKSAVRYGSGQADELLTARTDIDIDLRSGFDHTYIRDISIVMGTNYAKEKMEDAPYYLKPVLRKVSANLNGRKSNVTGSMEIDIDWEFWTMQDKTTPSVTLSRNVKYFSSGEYAKNIIKQTLEQAARLLAEEDTVRSLLLSSPSITAFEGEPLTIEGEAVKTFEARKDMLSAQIQSVVTIKTPTGHGSGFFIDRKGHILTNSHVVNNKKEMTVVTNSGLEMKATVLRENEDADLALLRVEIMGLPPLPLADADGTVVGEDLYAIGTPMDDALGQSVSRGILSGKRKIEDRLFLQTDVSINPGNSGGPILNEQGEVVGIATLKISDVGVEGLGFAIPIEEALKLLNLNYTK